jgi:hypothetical protein
MENSLSATVRNLNVFDGLALLVALGLTGVGFLIGTLGGGGSGATTSVELTVTPDNGTRSLAPGVTKTLPLYINNPSDQGVRVASISAGTSNATPAGCPAGSVTTVPIDGPAGFIKPQGVHAYDVSVTMAANADTKCKNQAFTVPLTATLVSAAGDRHFSLGSS